MARVPRSFTLRSPEERYGEGVRRIPQYELRIANRDDAVRDGSPMRTPPQARAFLAPIFEGWAQERLIAIYLNVRHVPVGWMELARGSSNVVHVSPRELFQCALLFGVPAVVIAHNHPSGDATPSIDDVALTDRVRAAGDLVGVTMLDHLVCADGGYYSFTAGRMFREKE